MLMIFPRRGSVQANGVTLRGHETVFAPCIYWQTAVFSVKIQHVGKGQALAGQTTPTRHAVSMQRKIIVSAEHSTPPHRREFLRCGMTGLASLSLPGLLKLRAEAGTQSRERTALIVVWLHGGASHLETYDPKPDAPDEYRGPFSPISTKVPGTQICELLPRHAAIADKFTILRSMVHTGICHNQGAQEMFSGRGVRDFRLKPEHPDCLTIASYLRHDAKRAIPNYVGAGQIPYIGSAYLGLEYEAFRVTGNPNDP